MAGFWAVPSAFSCQPLTMFPRMTNTIFIISRDKIMHHFVQFYNVDDTVAEAYDDSGDCILRRAYDPETDQDLVPQKEYRRGFLLKKLAATRFDHETKGVAFGEFRVSTDRQSQSMLTSAVVVAPDTETNWKMADGTFVLVTPRELAMVVAQHVAACFANEASLCTQIKSASSVEDLENIDLTQGWPGL
jgi:hypothetical protein